MATDPNAILQSMAGQTFALNNPQLQSLISNPFIATGGATYGAPANPQPGMMYAMGGAPNPAAVSYPPTGAPITTSIPPLPVGPPTTAVPPAAVPPAAPAPVDYAGMSRQDARAQWQGLPPQGLLQMLQRIQTANPEIFARLMDSGLAARFGLTPENLATMQSRQDVRDAWRAANPNGRPGFDPNRPAINPGNPGTGSAVTTPPMASPQQGGGGGGGYNTGVVPPNMGGSPVPPPAPQTPWTGGGGGWSTGIGAAGAGPGSYSGGGGGWGTFSNPGGGFGGFGGFSGVDIGATGPNLSGGSGLGFLGDLTAGYGGGAPGDGGQWSNEKLAPYGYKRY